MKLVLIGLVCAVLGVAAGLAAGYATFHTDWPTSITCTKQSTARIDAATGKPTEETNCGISR